MRVPPPLEARGSLEKERPRGQLPASPDTDQKIIAKLRRKIRPQPRGRGFPWSFDLSQGPILLRHFQLFEFGSEVFRSEMKCRIFWKLSFRFTNQRVGHSKRLILHFAADYRCVFAKSL